MLVDKLEIHLRKNIEIADDYKRMMIDNQKEVESHEKKLKTMEEEKAIFLTQFNQLALIQRTKKLDENYKRHR